MNVAYKSISFGPAPCGPGSKSQTISITKSISNFSYQILCVFSQIKNIKHIERDFHSVTRVMPQGRDFGSKFTVSEHSHVAYRIKGEEE